jgi:large subunit ribosomal protein L19
MIKFCINNEIILKQIEDQFIKLNKSLINVGDTLKIGIKIIEGEKTRVQFYEGTVISLKKKGLNETITIRKIFQGVGIERCFLVNSPKIDSIQVIKSSKVRRAKLYFLRNLSGKRTRLPKKLNYSKL